MLIIAVFAIVLVVLGIVEKIHIDRLMEKVPLRIMVNGSRGKTSTVRLIAAAMNENGIRTIAKTTGSEASVIYPDYSEKRVDRRRGRNMVREQRALFKEAVENRCDAVVCECMAVRPESQVVFSSKLFKPTDVVMTNFYDDHIDVMGNRTRDVLMLSVPDGVEPVVFSGEYEGDIGFFRTQFNRKSIGLALHFCLMHGLDERKCLIGMSKAYGDIGISDVLYIGDKKIVNGFAANDVKSCGELISSYRLSDVTVVYANRSDREFRLAPFRELFSSSGLSDIAVIGDNLFKCRHFFGCRSFKNRDFDKLIDSSRKVIICTGNIVGSGSAFLKYCSERSSEFLRQEGEFR